MSSLVFPYHDLNGEVFKYVGKVLPILKKNFDRAFVSITPKSEICNPESVEYFKKDSFFVVNFNEKDTQAGDHFVAAFNNAIKNSKSDEVLHLCTIDRLCFALLNYKNVFLADLNQAVLPTLFVRSEKAWLTHPVNYRAAESMVTTVGEVLFGNKLDFAWCHLTTTASQLKKVIPKLTAHDFVVFAQLVLSLKDIIITQEVDWLSWEDPFIFEKDSKLYKREREKDPAELEKRLSYVLPQIKYLFEEYGKLV